MGFSKEWDVAYKNGLHNSVWPWSDVVSLTKRYFRGDSSSCIKVLELGCGAGANIPFFVQSGCQYCGIEGSITEVEKLTGKFKDCNVSVKCADFTKEIPFDGKFDLVIDRSSVTHNKTQDIKKMISMIGDKLVPGGLYFGIDWFSSNYNHYDTDNEKFEQIDENTRVFTTGKFKGLGNVHFSDSQHIIDLFDGFIIEEIYEKVDIHVLPEKKAVAHWNFVARKK